MKIKSWITLILGLHIIPSAAVLMMIWIADNLPFWIGMYLGTASITGFVIGGGYIMIKLLIKQNEK